MRNPGGAVVGFLFGAGLLGGGVLMLLFALTGVVSIGSETSHWSHRVLAGSFAVFVLLYSHSTLAWARDALRPLDVSTGGAARIALKGPAPRVGQPLEGSIVMLGPDEPGRAFYLELSCSRIDTETEDWRTITAFLQSRRIELAPCAAGLCLPFSFDIPLAAPHTGARGGIMRRGYAWKLAFYPASLEVIIGDPPHFHITVASAPHAHS